MPTNRQWKVALYLFDKLNLLAAFEQIIKNGFIRIREFIEKLNPPLVRRKARRSYSDSRTIDGDTAPRWQPHPVAMVARVANIQVMIKKKNSGAISNIWGSCWKEIEGVGAEAQARKYGRWHGKVLGG